MSQIICKNQIAAAKNWKSYLPMHFTVGGMELAQMVFVKRSRENTFKRN